eukprot:366152-Rhodomonas_salina.1
MSVLCVPCIDIARMLLPVFLGRCITGPETGTPIPAMVLRTRYDTSGTDAGFPGTNAGLLGTDAGFSGTRARS